MIGLMVFVNLAFGEHIIGGEVIYECLGDGDLENTRRYKVIMKIYRDCQSGGADFDSAPGGAFTATVTIFQIGVTAVRRFELGRPTVRKIDFSANSCYEVPDYICVEEGTYEFEVVLPISDLSYYVSYQRCCRNPTITNINNPDRTGATYYVEITPKAQRVCNNSPQIKDFPPVVVCVNTPIQFNQTGQDAEGDSLVYELCSPLAGGGTKDNPPTAVDGIAPDPESRPPYNNTVIFTQPTFSVQNPLGRNAGFSIDRQTGILQGLPNIQGQFVTAVCISEYRNDTLLSVTRRDFQINVVPCLPAVLAKVEADTSMDQEFFFTSCSVTEFEFINQSTIRENIFTNYWLFQLGDDTLRINDWNAKVSFPGAGLFTGQLILNPNTLCGDTATLKIEIKPDIQADFELFYDTCSFGQVRFMDKSISGSGQITNWDWNFGDGTSSAANEPSHSYDSVGNYRVVLNVRDANACEAMAERSLAYFPLPSDAEILSDVTIGCSPQSVQFNLSSGLVNNTFQYRWEFGDGTFSDEPTPNHVFEAPGSYAVKLTVSSPTGCELEITEQDFITIEPAPIADFFYTPELVTAANPTVQFTDASQFAKTYEWQFGLAEGFFEPNPKYVFPDTGLYTVTLKVSHESGCVDTLSKVIDVIPIVQTYIASAFSPNNDGTNDYFKVEGLINGIENFSLMIWNRWGELVFSTKNLEDRWDGKYLSNNSDAPEGVYTYLIQYKAPRRGIVQYAGDLQLIR